MTRDRVVVSVGYSSLFHYLLLTTVMTCSCNMAEKVTIQKIQIPESINSYVLECQHAVSASSPQRNSKLPSSMNDLYRGV